MRSALRQVLWQIYMIKPVRSVSLYLLRNFLNRARKLGVLYQRPDTAGKRNERYSIGVVTYIRRYDQFFKPLVETLSTLFPDTEIVVAINGYYDQAKQEAYLAKITSFLASYPNIKPLVHREAQSLAKLWNQLIINSSCKKTLILNDDILILPSFRRQLEACGILACEVGLLKRTWSHFLISKQMISRIGWFDERLPGVGNEDEDYEARLALQGIGLPSFELSALRNVVVKTKDFSYGKEMAVINEKYTSDNKRFFNSKWEITNEAQDDFVHVRILQKAVRLRPGMETPNFYPEIHYPQVKS